MKTGKVILPGDLTCSRGITNCVATWASFPSPVVISLRYSAYLTDNWPRPCSIQNRTHDGVKGTATMERAVRRGIRSERRCVDRGDVDGPRGHVPRRLPSLP